MIHLRDAASALVDGELDGAARDRALAHVAVCPRCQADVDTARRTKARLARTAAATADLAVAQGLLDSLARVPERPIVAPTVSARPPARRYLAVAGVAASVLVGVGGGATTLTSASGMSPSPEVDTTVSTSPATIVSTTPLFSVRPHPRPALSVVYRRP